MKRKFKPGDRLVPSDEGYASAFGAVVTLMSYERGTAWCLVKLSPGKENYGFQAANLYSTMLETPFKGRAICSWIKEEHLAPAPKFVRGDRVRVRDGEKDAEVLSYSSDGASTAIRAGMGQGWDFTGNQSKNYPELQAGDKNCWAVFNDQLSRVAYADCDGNAQRTLEVTGAEQAWDPQRLSSWTSTVLMPEKKASMAEGFGRNFQWADIVPYDGTALNSVLKKLNQEPMSQIVKYVKDKSLTADEKLLRKHGLKDSNGNWTQDAYVLAQELNTDARSAEIVGILKERDAEAAAEKKRAKEEAA